MRNATPLIVRVVRKIPCRNIYREREGIFVSSPRENLCIERYKAWWPRDGVAKLARKERGAERKRGDRRKTVFQERRSSNRLNVRLFIGFCVVQRPRQSHQYIREGKGKRVSSTICKVFSRPTGRKAFPSNRADRRNTGKDWETFVNGTGKSGKIPSYGRKIVRLERNGIGTIWNSISNFQFETKSRVSYQFIRNTGDHSYRLRL